MIKKWKLLDSKPVLESHFVSVFKEKLEKPDGQVVDEYYSVKRRDASVVVALTKERKVPLVYQYKNGVKELVWEVPAGFIDQGEDPEQAARRELTEETGFEAERWIKLGNVAITTGTSPARNYLFLALGAEKTKDQNLDEHEEIEVKLFDFYELVEQVKQRKSFFIDVNSQLALLLSGEALKEIN